jgi:hypothetical protein
MWLRATANRFNQLQRPKLLGSVDDWHVSVGHCSVEAGQARAEPTRCDSSVKLNVKVQYMS